MKAPRGENGTGLKRRNWNREGGTKTVQTDTKIALAIEEVKDHMRDVHRRLELLRGYL